MNNTNIQFSTTIDIFNIVVKDYSSEVIISRGDLTHADCAYIYEQSVMEEFCISDLNKEVIIGAFIHYDSLDWRYAYLNSGDHYGDREVYYAILELRLYALNNNLVIYPSPPRRKKDCLPQKGGVLLTYVYQAEEEFDEYERFFDEYDDGFYHPRVSKSCPPRPEDKDLEDIPF